MPTSLQYGYLTVELEQVRVSANLLTTLVFSEHVRHRKRPEPQEQVERIICKLCLLYLPNLVFRPLR